MDFVLARRMMVDGQVRTRDVFDTNLLAAMGEVPRERFVPPEQAALAYLDRNVPLTAQGSGQAPRCLLQPMVLAHLLQAADIAEGESVLVVGCATGYTAAVVARVAGTVVALEEDRTLAATARRVLGDLAPQVKVVEGPLQAGWPEFGPYDVIVIEGAVEVIPPALFGQLKDGGRLVTIDGVRPGAKAAVYCSVKGDVSCRPLIEAAAPLLPGFAKPPAFVF
jgi:protein-L-isoaspartate(D-aspartate) O-methyltransferase